MSVESIKQVLFQLAQYAIKFRDFERGIRYLEMYLSLLDNCDRLALFGLDRLNEELHLHKKKLLKQKKLVKLMRLNMVYLKVTNMLLECCVGNYDYTRSLNYTINALFMYNNTIKMIHESDPYYYPSKKPTDIILMDKDRFNLVVENKEFFQKHVQYLNE